MMVCGASGNIGDISSTFIRYFSSLFMFAWLISNLRRIHCVDVSANSLPVITEHPLDVIVAKGEPATLNCAAKGQNVQILWYKDGQPVKTNKDESNSHRLILNTGSLFLLRVNNGKNGKDGDPGIYFCVAKNSYGEVRSSEATLKIAMLRDDFRVRPRTVQATIGNRAILECSPPRGFPDPVVSWRKDENDINLQNSDRITLHPSGNLIIDKVERSDNGFYQCIATNIVGEKISNPARLSVYEKPNFLEEPHDVIGEIASSILFDCRVSGDPMPSISWKKRNQQMPVGRAYIAPDNRGLRIDRLETSDEGEYICQAKNPAGSIEASAKLKVHSKPIFLITPSDVYAKIGNSATFECSGGGQPPPAIFWSKEGHQDLLFPGHSSQDERLKVDVDGKLVIMQVNVSDEGNYVCAIMNAAGSSLAKAQLSISNKEVFTNLPPLIEYGHSNQTLMIGSAVILPCKAYGSTPPIINWMKDNEIIDIADPAYNIRYKQLLVGSLQISNLIKSDSGVYVCRAYNEDGESTWTASLIVEDHKNELTKLNRMSDVATFPSAPSKPVLLNATHNSVHLKWNPPNNHGNSAISGYILQYFSKEMGRTWFNIPDYISSTQYEVKNLKPSTVYRFVVRAENADGIGPPSVISDIVRTAAYNTGDVNIDIAQQQLIKLNDARTINSSSVQLFWKKKQDALFIQGYYVKWRVLSKVDDVSHNNWINVTNPNINSYIVNDLRPFTSYEFFVIPYYKSIQGIPSNSLDASTSEAPPASTPTDVRVRMMNLTTLRISWRPPSPHEIYGVLKGYQIVILGNGAKYNRNITTNERAASVTLFHLVPGMTYGVKVAARNAAGVGVYHGLQAVTMNEATLREHIALMSGASPADQFLYLLKKPWFIAIVGVFLWIIFIVIISYLWWRWRKARGKSADSARLGMPFIKINDGSVHMTARDALWMDHNNLISAQRSLLLNNSINGVDYSSGTQMYTHSPSHNLYNQYLNENLRYNSAIAASNRVPSPSTYHYHYASLSNNFSTFNRQHMDDPSPYATTTLVMSNRQNCLNDTMRRCPALPKIPVPSGPPPQFQDFSKFKHEQVNIPLSNMRIEGFHQTLSPPQTDVSCVQSSDGNSGGWNDPSKLSTMTRERKQTPKETLMEIIPPPPPPPIPPQGPLSVEFYPHPNCRMVKSNDESVKSADHYDAVSDGLLTNGEQRPVSNNRFNGYRMGLSDREKLDEPDSSVSSFTFDKGNAPIRTVSSSDFDEDEFISFDNSKNDESRLENEDYKSNRPSQPCMGISASTLSQTCDVSTAKQSTSRLKSLTRNLKNDLV